VPLSLDARAAGATSHRIDLTRFDPSIAALDTSRATAHHNSLRARLRAISVSAEKVVGGALIKRRAGIRGCRIPRE